MSEANKSLTVFTSVESAVAVNNEATNRTVSIRMKNPTRHYSVNVPNDAWASIANSPEQYRELLTSVLDTAAGNILRKFVNEYQSVPTEIPAIRLTAENILSAAMDGNSDNYTKEELTEAWNNSETKKLMISKQAYKDNRAYRDAFSRFEELVLKLAGRNTQYTESEFDSILAKLADDDLSADWGQWAVRRINALRNKPAKQAIDLNIL